MKERAIRRRLVAVVLVLAVAGAGAGTWWWFQSRGSSTAALTLYGNVDMREVSAAFTDTNTVAKVNVDEGDRVRKGDVIAELTTDRIVPALAQAEGQVAAQTAAVNKLKAGSRPEEIAQARANAAAAHADATNAQAVYERTRMLASTGSASAASQAQVDAAKNALDAATAKANAADQTAALVALGPRAEDIAQAEAQLAAARAARDLVRQQLADAVLTAPVDGVIRSRLLEPGEVASPQRPVVSIAVLDPKWIRTYVSGPDLPRVQPGMKAAVSVDGLAEPLDGQVGFISPVAEFTPHTVQTAELRTSLVYEVRVLVSDPADRLRLGMPATVRLLADNSPAVAAEARP